ncbi:hypothetical protein ACOSQ4_017274 [Xanthoceras sorbifolium]
MICKIRETINGWVSSPQVKIQTMARRMIANFKKYRTDIPGVMAVAAVWDPRYKILRVDFHFGKLYVFDASRQRDKVIGLLNELFKEYKSKVLTGSTLVEKVEDNLPNFNILSWWKVNKGKYLILAKIAKDILVIPVGKKNTQTTFI